MNDHVDNAFLELRNKRKTNKIGKLHLTIGCMFSEKTTSLIRCANRYTRGNKKCFIIKYSGDTRYHKQKVAAHSGMTIDAIPTDYLYKVDSFVDGYDVILIDEIQFFKDGHIYADQWANEGFIVECFGLNGKFDRTPWNVISNLLPLCEEITFNKAVCEQTGNDAVYSNHLTADKANEIMIGGSEQYNAVDRETFFNNLHRKEEDIKRKLENLKKLIFE